MAWPMDVENAWHRVPRWSRRPVARSQALLTLGLAGDVLAAYTTPGQFVKVRTPAGDAFFALANQPGSALELLVKEGGAVADWLLQAPEGTPLDVTAPQGAGFRVTDLSEGTAPLLCATGSGIAPVRPLMSALVALKLRPTLLYGGRFLEELAFLPELRAYQERGQAEVRVFVSQGELADRHARGWLVDALQPGAFPYERTVAFLCGVPAMVKQATSRLTELGVPPERIRLNF
ncbi:MAG: FAD-dependent oxidoreductase [Myxococcota bacterium]